MTFIWGQFHKWYRNHQSQKINFTTFYLKLNSSLPGDNELMLKSHTQQHLCTWLCIICILVSASLRAVAPRSTSSRADKICESFRTESRSSASFSFFTWTTSSTNKRFSRAWASGGRPLCSGTSLKRPPLKVGLNERWSLTRDNINMICKDSGYIDYGY